MNPNHEQKLAIEHNGGVLLEAGAGSGKTFVLIEHIIYLFDNFIKKNENIDDLQFTLKFIDYFSKKVVMTFTNKAANELSLRLLVRIEKQLQQKNNTETNYSKWVIVKQYFTKISISTIHGFCLRLIKQGYVLGIPTQLKIINDNEFQIKIEKIFEDWLKPRISSISEFDQFAIANRKEITQMLVKIFSDPSLRFNWQTNTLAIFQKKPEDLLKQIIIEKGWEKIFSIRSLLNDHLEIKTTKPYLFLEEFNNQINFENINIESIKKWIIFFNELYPRLPQKPRDKSLIEIRDLFSIISSFRDFIVENVDSIEGYFEYHNGYLAEWMVFFEQIVKFVETNYQSIPGLIFSDLEYYVLKSLEDINIINKVSRDYDYIIVDEFQDTSYIQYEIITKVLNRDLSKLFCVGDIKQAIYGFRGGEVQVFKNCLEQINLNLKMINNFRSSQQIVNFNNQLFDFLFSKGIDFIDNDKFAVKVDHQHPAKLDDGEINKILIKPKVIDEEPFKINLEQVAKMEALAIRVEIQKRLLANEQICVLYKALGPSIHLIDELINNDIGFTAQAKLPFLEDPLVGILFILLEGKFSDNVAKSNKMQVFLIDHYLKILGIQNKVDYTIIQKVFDEDIIYYGLTQAFHRLIHNLGINNATPDSNILKLIPIFELLCDDVGLVYTRLKNLAEIKLNTNFIFGNEANQVLIMTAHASKGLEFDHLILGGIFNNGKRPLNTNILGNEPGSFKWKKEKSKKNWFKTPQYFLENIISEQKDFSESKRLFYVACTRARKSLTWIDFSNDYKWTGDKSSWIFGFRFFESESNQVVKNIKTIEYEVDHDFFSKSRKKFKKPLFHLTNFGISRVSYEYQLGIISDLSVTKIATLADCSKKFYLESICRISDDDLNDLKLNIRKAQDSSIVSSSERGSEIHEALSWAIKRNWILPFDKENKLDKEGAEWALELLKKYKEDYLFISEQELKFSINGIVVTGTPDLVCLPKEKKEWHIFDFKTGAYKEQKIAAYKMQLELYAIGYYDLQKVKIDQKVHFHILFIDEKKDIDYLKSFDQVKNSIDEQWIKLSKPFELNTQHCGVCKYGNICPS